jgi:UDP-2,3-diacylglucosamine hydrolase
VDSDLAAQWLRDAGTRQMIHGHTHRPGTQTLPHGFVRHVLSDWDLDTPPPRAEVVRITQAGLQRLHPTDALQPC